MSSTNVMAPGEEEELQRVADILEGQKEVRSLTLAFEETMAVKCVLELRIPDIIHSHGSPMSLSQIATNIGSPSLDISYLSRVMRFLVHKNIFSTAAPPDQSGETLYDLTRSSRLLLHGSDQMTLAPMLYMVTHPLLMDPWQQLSGAIKDGTTVIEKAYGHGSSMWKMASTNPELNNVINGAMVNMTKFNMLAIMSAYKDGFEGVETLVDVGGGKGSLLAEIVKANWPRIRGINFELQHVVESAPAYPGVTHVAGDMFQSVPDADAIIMKSVLHNWSDEDCKKILRNCRRTLLKTTGKLILVDVVIQPEEQELLGDIPLKLDLLMMVHCVGGRERTQVEWTTLLEDAGFSQLKFIKTPIPQFIIEAYAS